MNSGEIIHALTHYERLPAEAIRATGASRATTLPVFLDAIETYLAQSDEERKRPSALFFIFHILGSWRETSAYRPLAQLLQSQRGDDRSAIGDAAVETSHRVMAAVFDGDPQPLYDIILDPEVDEFIRSRMCEAIAMVTLQGKLQRSVATRFLESCFEKLEPKTNCYVWCGWADAIAMLGLADLKPLVATAFERGSIDDSVMEIRHFNFDLAKSLEHPDGSCWLSDKEHSLFGDTVEELSTWYGFSDKYSEDQRRLALNENRQLNKPILADLEPVRNPLRRVGRNDPCPCGSGKKYKKCCPN